MKKVFSCKLCGHCCHGNSTVSLSQADQKAIASFLGLTVTDFLQKFCIKKGNRIEMKIVDGHCIFYGDDGLCKIHEVKPFQCKRWPLHPSILKDRRAWNAIKADCPGFDKNARYEDVCELVKRANNEY
jgi:Fe-S-cluster containining protein